MKTLEEYIRDYPDLHGRYVDCRIDVDNDNRAVVTITNMRSNDVLDFIVEGNTLRQNLSKKRQTLPLGKIIRMKQA